MIGKIVRRTEPRPLADSPEEIEAMIHAIDCDLDEDCSCDVADA